MQEVLNNSDHHPVLFLSNLVEGTYTFNLKVTDAKGETNADRATVEVKPGEFLSQTARSGREGAPLEEALTASHSFSLLV